jgi:arabinogalactan endo-1,4-beta-galactosidase
MNVRDVAAVIVLAMLSSVALAAEASAPRPPSSRATPAKFYAGADISMLPEIEKLGGAFHDSDGRATNAIAILRGAGCNLFRIRLFVDPDPDFARSHGATQGLPYVRALCKRIKSAGGELLLDLHYSDTWADPGKQFKPAAWKDLEFDALERRVHDYTADVLKALREDGVVPEMVQVGNEIASGILWPDGKVAGAEGDDEAKQWEKFARLVRAGVTAVREASTPKRPIRIMIHIHGGGKKGMAKWFFGEKLAKYPIDFDIVGLSFYPTWEDEFDALKPNLADAVAATGKDVLIAEVSYPWKEIPDIKNKPTLHWPRTPAGQLQFLRDLTAAVKAMPDHHGIGWVYWYPEAIPVGGRRIWRGGGEAVFDEKGNALPSLSAFAVSQRD